MKTAFELAMERLGGESRTYTDEQKKELAEIDSVHDAKVAEAKLSARERIKAAAGDAAQIDQIQNDMAVELASISEQREKKKEALRQRFQGDGE